LVQVAQVGQPVQTIMDQQVRVHLLAQLPLLLAAVAAVRLV
jgi:hypothetical protein